MERNQSQTQLLKDKIVGKNQPKKENPFLLIFFIFFTSFFFTVVKSTHYMLSSQGTIIDH